MSERTDKMTKLFEEVQRTFAPLAVGFETLFENAALTIHNATGGYPPYNMIRGENGETIIEVAVAGISKNDIRVYLEKNSLHVAYEKTEHERENEIDYTYKGIAGRAFDLSFPVAEGIVVDNAKMRDGLLRISLKRVFPLDHLKNFVEIQTD